jgi:hypothetical protein
VHDTVDLEIRGIPSVFVASEVFVDAAVSQADALGLDVARVFVPHPIQDRTDEEMRAMADQVIEQLLSRLRAD